MVVCDQITAIYSTITISRVPVKFFVPNVVAIVTGAVPLESVS